MTTITTWTETPRPGRPLRPQDLEERVLRLQMPRGPGRRFRVNRAGPDHLGQCSRRVGLACPGPTPGEGINRGQGLRQQDQSLASDDPGGRVRFVSPCPSTGTTPQVLAGAPQDREKVR